MMLREAMSLCCVSYSKEIGLSGTIYGAAYFNFAATRVFSPF
jgi:hypothetical protein